MRDHEPEPLPDAPVLRLGRRVRRVRLARGQRQEDLAAKAGVTQDMISRIELGRGGSVPLEAWLAVASVLSIDLGTRDPDPEGVGRIPFERLVARGGWTVTRPEGGLRFEREARTPEGRPLRPWLVPHEIAVALVADVLVEPGPWLQALDLAGLDALEHRTEEAAVSGVLVVPRTSSNRRRIRSTVGRDDIDCSAAWFAALGDPTRPMPRTPGIVWLDTRAVHLAPLMPLS